MKETIVKINKTKSWFSEKINQIHKPFQIHQGKKEKTEPGRNRNYEQPNYNH